MNPTIHAARHAVIAANNRARWGRYAAARYAKAHDVPAALFILACGLAAAQKAGL